MGDEGRPSGEPGPGVDYRAAAGAYVQSRTLAAHQLAPWRTALEPYLGDSRAVLDLGAGTGQFAAAFVEWLGAAVIAVEPRAQMAAQAPPSPGVLWVQGRGEAIPLADRSVDGAWLSAVVHHFSSLDAVAAELARVVRTGGAVVVRGFFRDLPVPWHFAQFPGVERSVARFPASADVAAVLARHGLRPVAEHDVAEPHALGPGWEDRLRRMRPADTMLAPLTDDEFEAGIAVLRSELGDARGGHTVDVALRLLVSRLGG